MCGICGFISYKQGGIEESALRMMCAAMRHRGPDDEGVYINNNITPSVGLGHRRLSIIDLSSEGHQPMPNEDKTAWIIFNGEIYNYLDLRSELEGKGHHFRSHTDTETVIHLYEEYGRDCLKYLRGMFAFAIWDEKDRSLLLARDRVGKKPLLYSYAGGVFCFASEFAPLLAGGFLKKDINQEALHYYLSFGYIPAPLTIYKGVFRLLPAHTLVLKDNEITLQQYWQLSYCGKLNISENEAAQEVLRLLKEAVKVRLYSDVPLGAFLSGGIDSSTVVALMSQLSREKVKTFSIGFEKKDYSELRYARDIAQRFNTEHREFIVKPNALKILPLLIERYGEPYADSSCIPTYYVSQQTRQHVTVALNGDGGDELFCGYERYQAMIAAEVYNRFPALIKKATGAAFSLLPDSLSSKSRLRNIRRFFEAAGMATNQRYLRWVGIFETKLKDALYSEDFRRKMEDKDPIAWLSPYLGQDKLDLLDRLLMADTYTYLPNDLLVKVDIASMANSLEARSPFLDHKLMEFVARLPVEYKMKNFIKKYIIKKAIKGLVPEGNIHRRKMGFGVPVGEWFREELKLFLEETLLSKKSLSRGYFKAEKVSELVRQHTSGRRDYASQLWALLILELWHRRFID